ncbi:hypothetical protein ON05_006280 [Acaryochloris sp. CCMEE 5410]|nr:hypothetical protein ON05_006280 [Acaryochloris sp. CCMEE 5410]
MRLVVEAWFYNSIPQTILELLNSALTLSGFTGTDMLTTHIRSWDSVTLEQHKVFVALNAGTEDHIVVRVQARIGWSEGYSAFEKVFLHLLKHRQSIHLAELFFSVRNSQPYPFLTHSFYRGFFPPTIVNPDENRVSERGGSTYWVQWGPELHFIADKVFERTAVDAGSLAHDLNAAIIDVEGGVLLDCGWAQEFVLPQRINSI